MIKHDDEYLKLLRLLLEAPRKEDRTGTGTRSIFGYQMRFDLSKGFPILTSKYINLKTVTTELNWFLNGDTNIKYLQDRGCNIWNEWADEFGELGPIYGKQWRDFKGVDQIKNLLDNLRNNPNSRRHIVTAWNPPLLKKMKLEPCHCLFQFYVIDNRLSCQLYQRSADVFLGVPFNIASYALLTHAVADQLGMVVGDFIWTGGDVHLYDNHIEQAKEQLSRKYDYSPKLVNCNHNFPWTLSSSGEGCRIENDLINCEYALEGYNPQPFIKAPVAV